MFKTLITTCLLTFSCSSGALKFKEPLRANNIYTLHGSYVFRDDMTFAFSQIFEKYRNQMIRFDYGFVNNTNNFYQGLFYYNNNYYVGGFDSFNLAVYFSSTFEGSSLDYMFDLDDNGTSISFSAYEVYLDEINSWNDYLDYFECTNVQSLRYHTLYIENTLNVSESAYDIFNCIYTPGGNTYNTAYHGYYTFIAPFTYSFYADVKLTTITDNNIYNFMCLEPSNILRVENNNYVTTDNTYYDAYVYNNGYQLSNNSVYLSGMIPMFLYDKLNSIGEWGFIPEPIENYSFGDFFFGIADVPVYILFSLFNFDLFGINLFIALSSIITLCIVIIFIKKVA